MTPYFRTVVDRDEVASTSDLARELVESGAAEIPLLVRARAQTSGRGRGENRWWSDAGSLTFTIALDPAAHGLRRDHEPRLALTVAVGLIEVVKRMAPLPPLSIRWPNDVESGGRKLAGVLPERVETDRGARLLIGVGLNVTTRLDDAPPAVRDMATSLHLLGPRAWDADLVLGSFLADLPALLDRLATDDPGLSASWAGRDALRDQAVRVNVATDLIHGIGLGIDPTGGLILRTDRGPVTLHGGQVLRP